MKWNDCFKDEKWWTTIISYILFIMLFALFVCNCTLTPEKWSKRDIILHGTMTTLMGADWLQTRYISKHEDKYYEKNFILGKHPSESEVNLYFGACWIGATVITHFTKAKYRWLPQLLITAIETEAVIHNNSVGVGFKF